MTRCSVFMCFKSPDSDLDSKYCTRHRCAWCERRKSRCNKHNAKCSASLTLTDHIRCGALYNPQTHYYCDLHNCKAANWRRNNDNICSEPKQPNHRYCDVHRCDHCNMGLRAQFSILCNLCAGRP
jgi:hypothetical protein